MMLGCRQQAEQDSICAIATTLTLNSYIRLTVANRIAVFTLTQADAPAT